MQVLLKSFDFVGLHNHPFHHSTLLLAKFFGWCCLGNPFSKNTFCRWLSSFFNKVGLPQYVRALCFKGAYFCNFYLPSLSWTGIGLKLILFCLLCWLFLHCLSIWFLGATCFHFLFILIVDSYFSRTQSASNRLNGSPIGAPSVCWNLPNSNWLGP